MIYESEVLAASHGGIGSPRRHMRKVWGDRAVLILIGHRLGIDGVNPIYYDFLKVSFASLHERENPSVDPVCRLCIPGLSLLGLLAADLRLRTTL